MEKKNDKCNTFGSEQVASKLNLINSYARKFMHGEAAHFTKDAAMDSVEKALKSVHKFSGTEAQFNAWLKMIVKNTCNDWVKRKKAYRTSDGNISAISEKNGFFCELDIEEFSQEGTITVHKALDRMPEKTKELIVLIDLYGWSGKEVSEATGLNEKFVSIYHKRAIEKMKEIVLKISA